MDLGLKDRVAMVAASSKGLGKAVAEGLAREGAKLALCARSEALHATADEIRRKTGVEGLRGKAHAMASLAAAPSLRYTVLISIDPEGRTPCRRAA